MVISEGSTTEGTYRQGYYEGYLKAIEDFRRYKRKPGELDSFLTQELNEWAFSLSDEYEEPPKLESNPITPKAKVGVVYWIRLIGTDYYKIGYTYNLKRRMNQIKNNVPSPIELIKREDTLQPKDIEKLYHRQYKPFRTKNGEWFNIPEDIINTKLKGGL